MTKQTPPTPRQTDARRRQRAFGDSLRDWLHDREIAAENRKTKRRKARLKPALKVSRGVDRVPTRLQGNPLQRPPDKGPDAGASWARQSEGTYRNPARVERLRKSGRLRKELR